MEAGRLLVLLFLIQYSCHAQKTSILSYCSGVKQSPIALTTCQHVHYPDLQLDHYWQPTSDNFVLHNTAQTVKIYFPGETVRPSVKGGPLNDTYLLSEIHFHWGPNDDSGSEHWIGDTQSAMEAHLVHYNQKYADVASAVQHKDGVAVLAVLFDVNDENSESMEQDGDDNFQEYSGEDYGASHIEPIANNLVKIARDDLRVKLDGSSALAWFKPYLEDQHYFTYSGSLTAPPCNEGVTWIVFRYSAGIEHEQLQQFRNLRDSKGQYKRSNYRELQDLNGRSVYCSPAVLNLPSAVLVILAVLLQRQSH